MKHLEGVTRPQQIRALSLSTLAFTTCFAVWTIFSIIGIKIKQDLGLNETQFGILVATPILTGSIIRIFLGIWTEQFGGRRVFSLLMLVTAACVFLLSFVVVPVDLAREPQPFSERPRLLGLVVGLVVQG